MIYGIVRPTALVAAFYFAFFVENAMAATNLRASTGNIESPSFQESILEQLVLLAHEIDILKQHVQELESHRRMDEDCALTLAADGYCTLDADFAVNGNITLEGGLIEISGSDVTIDANVDVLGPMTSIRSKDFIAYHEAILYNATVVENLEVMGATEFDSSVEAKSNVQIDGDSVTKGTSEVNKLNVKKSAKVKGKLTLENDVKVKGSKTQFKVEGDMDLGHDLFVNDNVEVGNDLGVENNINVEGGLSVVEDVTFGGDLEVRNELTVLEEGDREKGRSSKGDP